MSYLLKQCRMQFLLLAAVIVMVAVVPSTALGAIPPSLIYHNAGAKATVCLSAYPGYNNYCRTDMPHRSKFRMMCWVDNWFFFGNYRTNRWFYGQAFSNGSYGWVHASYVRSQQRVPHRSEQPNCG